MLIQHKMHSFLGQRTHRVRWPTPRITTGSGTLGDTSSVTESLLLLSWRFASSIMSKFAMRSCLIGHKTKQFTATSKQKQRPSLKSKLFRKEGSGNWLHGDDVTGGVWMKSPSKMDEEGYKRCEANQEQISPMSWCKYQERENCWLLM